MSVRSALRLATAAIVLSFLAVTFADPDLWGHLTFGRDIVRQHWVHGGDPYSFTADIRWINHEWLAEAVMWLAWRMAGSVGLVTVKLMLVCAAGAAVLSAWSDDALPDAHRDVLLFATALGVWPLLLTMRPQVFSVALFAILMLALRRIRDGSRPWLWAIPPLFAVWVNVHGGWIVGAGVLAVFVGCSLFDRAFTWRGRVALAATAAVAAGATLLNPYGAAMLDFLSRTVGPSRADIVEWQSIDRLPPIAAALWAIPAGLCAAACWKRGRALPIPFVVVAILLGVAALRVARLGGFFALAVAVALAPAACESSRREEISAPTWRGRLSAVAVTAALVIGAAALFGRHIAASGPWLPDREAVEYARTQHLHGRMLTWFDYGEYAIWHLAPDIRVSMDGRRETVYSERMRALHSTIYANAPSAANAVSELAPDYLWLPRSLPATERLERAGWRPLFVGARSTILARDAGTAVHADEAETSPRYFPGP